MDISFVVCTYSIENLHDTIKCINSLIDQDNDSDNDSKEILLVMDKNEELYDALLEHIPKSVKIIINNGVGLSAARNTGVDNAKGDIVIFIDDDAVASKDYVSHLTKNYCDESVIGVGGKILPKGMPGYPEELYWLGGFTYKGYPENKCEVRNVIGCNMSFRRRVFNDVGLFNANFGRIGRKLVTCEETEFCIRTLSVLIGSKIIYDPSVIVYHKVYEHRQKMVYIIKRAYYEGIAKANIETLYGGNNNNGECNYGNNTNKNALSTENTYFKYLFTHALPGHIKNIIIGRNVMFNIRSIVSLFLVVTSVGFGYITTKMKIEK